MDHYFQTYYQNHCHPEQFTWFDSFHYPLIVSHSLSIIVIPLQIYGAYCILFQTPQRMLNIKWALFHLHFWISFYDLGINLLFTLLVFLPQNCQFGVGLVSRTGLAPWIQAFLGQCIMGMIASALVIIFENRHNAIVMDRFKIPNLPIRWAFYIFNYLAGTILMLPPYFLTNEPDQDAVKLKMLEEYPCPAPDFFDDRLVLFYDDTKYYELFAQIQFATCCSQSIFFIVHSCYYLLSKKIVISEHTRKLQLKVFKAICLQVTIPLLVLALPICYMVFAIYSRYYNQTLTNTMSIVTSFHGILSTITLIFIYEPYRSFTKNIFVKFGNPPLRPVQSVSF